LQFEAITLSTFLNAAETDNGVQMMFAEAVTGTKIALVKHADSTVACAITLVVRLKPSALSQ
jgi:hypothetical protein